jgi:hypothetical protein
MSKTRGGFEASVSYMASNTLIEATLCEDSICGGKMLLPIQSLFFQALELWIRPDFQWTSIFGSTHCTWTTSASDTFSARQCGCLRLELRTMRPIVRALIFKRARSERLLCMSVRGLSNCYRRHNLEFFLQKYENLWCKRNVNEGWYKSVLNREAVHSLPPWTTTPRSGDAPWRSRSNNDSCKSIPRWSAASKRQLAGNAVVAERNPHLRTKTRLG